MTSDYQGKPPQQFPPRSHHDRGNSKPLPVIMLVMGLRGCGKSSLINLATGQTDCAVSINSRLCTRSPRTCKFTTSINGCEFKFIDTPGFGDENFSDREVFEKIVGYLAPNPRLDRLPRRVTGLLYIHSEDEPIKNRAYQNTIEMLVRVLGERFLDRVTVLIQSRSNAQVDVPAITQSSGSALYPLFSRATKPWAIKPYPKDTQSLEDILREYCSLEQRLVRLAVVENFMQRDGNVWQYHELSRHLKEYFPEEIGPPVVPEQILLQEQEDELEKLRTSLVQKQEEIKNLQSTHENELKGIHENKAGEKSDHELHLKTLLKTIREQGEELSVLKSERGSDPEKFEALQREISRLTLDKDLEIQVLQTQLREKDDAIKVLEEKLRDKGEELANLKSTSERRIQGLIDGAQAKGGEMTGSNNGKNDTVGKAPNQKVGEISRLEEEIRRTKAEYASLRTTMQLEENTEQADITTILGDINRLIEEFGQGLSEHIEIHMKNNPSEKVGKPQDLLSMFGPIGGEEASRIKQDAYALFEYAVQATVCDLLCMHLFRPFHPNIADDEKRNEFIIRLYEQVAHQVPQSVAGRWRKDAYNSISKDPSFGNQGTPDDKRMQRIITAALSPIIGKIVESQPHEVLEKQERALAKVIIKAEELNRLLKGGVSMLGDFQPIVYPFGEVFQPDCMSEVNSKKKAKLPETIIATVELGLMKRYAVGGGRRPEETILRKAGVYGLPK